MARIDVVCPAGHVHEVDRPIAMWPNTPRCPECDEVTVQTFQPKQTQWSVDPVVVYKTPDGSFRFPGDVTTRTTRTYDALGYERIELRSAADVRRFETVMNKREYSRAARRVEAMQAHREQREKVTRSTLRGLMQSMSPFGQALAREAMKRNDLKPRERTKDVNFHVEAYSYDHSNRDESRSADGRRRRD